jgi:hypothetical protein
MKMIKSFSSAIQAKLLLALVMLMAVPPVAFATGGGTPDSFDSAAILALIAAFLAIAVLLYGAWIAGLWTMKVLGLLKPKG